VRTRRRRRTRTYISSYAKWGFPDFDFFKMLLCHYYPIDKSQKKKEFPVNTSSSSPSPSYKELNASTTTPTNGRLVISIYTHTTLSPSNSSASADTLEIVLVRRRIQAAGAIVAARVIYAHAHLDLVQRVRHLLGVAGRQPDLRAGVAVSKELAWVAREGIVIMGDAVVGAGLRVDELDERLVSHARAAERDDVGRDARCAQVRRCDRGHRAPETVSYRDHLVRRVGFHRGLDGLHRALLHIHPCVLEALVQLAARDSLQCAFTAVGFEKNTIQPRIRGMELDLGGEKRQPTRRCSCQSYWNRRMPR